MAIAEHDPSAVSKKNRGVLKMSHQQLHDFAATKEKKLPRKRSKTSSQPARKGDVHAFVAGRRA